jgi:hypothetical protein
MRSRVAEVEHRGEQRDARDLVLVGCLQHRDGGREQRPADAEPERVHLIRAGQLEGDVEGLDHAVLEVVVPGQRALLRSDVAPRHHVHVLALVAQVAHQRVVGLQVHDVELVDAGRDHHDRPLVDLVAGGLVVDQLHQVVLEDDLARHRGDVLPDLVGRLVGGADAPLRDILEEQVHALGDALSARFDRELHRLGVGEEEVRRAHRVDELAHAEAHLRLGLVVERHRFDRPLQELGVGQVGTTHEIEARVVAPRVAREALVVLGAGRLLGHGRERLPEGRHLLQEVLLQLVHLARERVEACAPSVGWLALRSLRLRLLRLRAATLVQAREKLRGIEHRGGHGRSSVNCDACETVSAASRAARCVA